MTYTALKVKCYQLIFPDEQEEREAEDLLCQRESEAVSRQTVKLDS